MEKNTRNLLIGCGGLSSLCCVSGVFVAIFAHNDIESHQPLMNVCANQPLATAAEPSRHVVRAAHMVGNRWMEYQRAAPGAWATSSDAAMVSHVLCVGEPRESELDSASYENDVTITRFTKRVDYRLVEARTGRVVHEASLVGAVPDFPESVSTIRLTRRRIRVSSNNRRLVGDPPTTAQLEQEFGKYLR